MSETSAPLAPDTGAHPHSPPPSPGTSLLNFPPDATFQIYRKPNGKDAVEPVDGGSLHVSEFINSDGNHVLVCFATMAPDDWGLMREHLRIGKDLGINPIVVGSVDRAHIASGLWGADSLAGNHGLTKEPGRPTVFVPSATLMRILKIERGTRARNALILVRNGCVVAEWISGGDGDQPHDWTTILSMVS